MTSSKPLFFRLSSVFFQAAVFLVLMSAFPAAAVSKANLVTSYSADMVMITPAGEISGTSRLYITPQAYRMDGMLMGAGQQGMPEDMTILGLNDQNRQYIYNHDKKLVYESGLDEQETVNLLKAYQNADAEEILGKETVSGYACTKKKVTTTMDMMGMKITSTQTIWQSDRFEMPLRTRTEDGHMSELRNIVVQKPSANLFQPLAGYKPASSFMAVMGMDFSGNGHLGSGPAGGKEPAAHSEEDSSRPTDSTSSGPEGQIEKAIQNIGDKLKSFRLGN